MFCLGGEKLQFFYFISCNQNFGFLVKRAIREKKKIETLMWIRVFDLGERDQMAQQRQFQMEGNSNNSTNDTKLTKIFVGGLAWETQRDTMRRYFEQFGEIVEAVVITDKNTGRSKGYGFVCSSSSSSFSFLFSQIKFWKVSIFSIHCSGDVQGSGCSDEGLSEYESCDWWKKS